MAYWFVICDGKCCDAHRLAFFFARHLRVLNLSIFIFSSSLPLHLIRYVLILLFNDIPQVKSALKLAKVNKIKKNFGVKESRKNRKNLLEFN